MTGAELLIATLLVAVAALGGMARYISVPYPILLVLSGAALGFVPGLPEVELDPDAVLLIFLPPLLYGAAIFSNFGDMRADTRALTMSTIGLVLGTMCAVAVVAHALIPDMPWEGAFVLGAIVSPTDPLAGSLVLRRLGAPRRLVSIVEGEGLFNDATALVAYKVAVAAVVVGSFSLADAGVDFVFGALGGVAIGLIAGVLIGEMRKRISDIQLNVTLSLLTGYAAFIPADAIGASGILATVTAGLYMGVRGPQILPTEARLQATFVWDILDFAVNALLFILIGLQLHTIVDGLSGYSVGSVIGYALAVSATVLAARFAWLFTTPYLLRLIDRRPSQKERRLGAAPRLVIAWSGMRGAVSLAIALALPLTTDAGSDFPHRDLIIFLAFAVIFFSLVGQGLTLPALLRRTGVTEQADGDDEELRARLVAAKAALRQLDSLAEEEWTRDDTIERLRRLYQYRKRRFAARAGMLEDDGYEDRSLAYQQTLQLILEAQREALVQIRNEGQISNETMLRVVRELDLEEARLES